LASDSSQQIRTLLYSVQFGLNNGSKPISLTINYSIWHNQSFNQRKTINFLSFNFFVGGMTFVV